MNQKPQQEELQKEQYTKIFNDAIPKEVIEAFGDGLCKMLMFGTEAFKMLPDGTIKSVSEQELREFIDSGAIFKVIFKKSWI